MVGLQCAFVVRSSGVLGLPYKKQLCLPTDYHCVNSLALEDCHCNTSEIAYMGTLLCLVLFVCILLLRP